MFKPTRVALSLFFLEAILQSPLIANAERKVTVLVDNGENWYQSLPAHHTRFRPGEVEVDPYNKVYEYFDEDFFVVDVVVFRSQESVIWNALNELYYDKRTNYQSEVFPHAQVWVDLYNPQDKWHFAASLNDEDGWLAPEVTIGHFDNEPYDSVRGYYRSFDTDRRIFRISFPYAIKELWYKSSVGRYKGDYERGFDDSAYSTVNNGYFNEAYYRRPKGPKVVSSSHSYPLNEYSNAHFHRQEAFSYDKYVGNVPRR